MAAASDLQGVLPNLAERFTAATGITITPVVGASGQLAEQIRQGAPFDVFLSANIAYVRKLASEGHITADSVRVYAQGRLVLVVNRQSNVTVKALADLTGPEVKHIAIANPDVAPYGLAARQTLEKSGLWDSLKPKVVQAETVRQAMQFVQSGNAEVGLVAHSVAEDPRVRKIDVDPRCTSRSFRAWASCRAPNTTTRPGGSRASCSATTGENCWALLDSACRRTMVVRSWYPRGIINPTEPPWSQP